MPYQGVALMFALGLGIATAALIYLLREQERLEQPYGGSAYGSGSDNNEHLRNHWPRPDEHPSSRRRRRRNGADGTICAICQEEMSPGGLPYKKLRCEHSFHNRCIDQWAQRKRECPYCRHAF